MAQHWLPSNQHEEDNRNEVSLPFIRRVPVFQQRCSVTEERTHAPLIPWGKPSITWESREKLAYKHGDLFSKSLVALVRKLVFMSIYGFIHAS